MVVSSRAVYQNKASKRRLSGFAERSGDVGGARHVAALTRNNGESLGDTSELSVHFLTIMCCAPRPKENKKAGPAMHQACWTCREKKQLPLVRLEFMAVKKVDGGGWAGGSWGGGAGIEKSGLTQT